MKEVIFVTHNKGKIASAKKHLKEVNFKIFEYELEKDILGGIQNGIDTCWFNHKKLCINQYKTNYEITELLELKNIL